MTYLELLERIADKAEEMRSLERELIRATDTRRVMDALKESRQELDDLFRDRRAMKR